MRPASAALRSAFAGSRTTASRVELLAAGTGRVLASSEPNAATRLTVVEGKVTADATRAILRTCSVTLADPTGTLTPAAAADLLAPYGNELKLYAGARLPTGAAEYVALGVFSFDDVEADDEGGSVTIRLEGYDRAGRVAGRFSAPYVVAAGTNYVDAITALVQARYPGVPMATGSTPHTTPLLVFEEQADAWEAVQAMAAAIGCRAYFDPEGTFRLEAVPDPATQPVAWSFLEDVNALAVAVHNRIKRAPYNGVIVTSESTGNAAAGAIVRAEAWDTDPDSPTYRYGPLGDRPTWRVSRFITSQAQGDAYAAAELLKVKQGAQVASFTAVPVPLLEPLDVVQLARARVKVSGTYALERVDYDLAGLAPMSVTTRERAG